MFARSKVGFEDVLQLAGNSRGADEFGYRSEFLGLVRLAESLDTPTQAHRQASR